MRISTIGFRAMGRTSCKVLALVVAIAACLPVYAVATESEAAQETVVIFDIPAGDLAATLERFSTQSGIQAMYRQELVTGKRSGGVRGSLLPSVALTRILSGTGLSIERANASTYVLKLSANPVPDPGKLISPDSEPKAGVEELEKVVVVGSRLGVSPYDVMSMAKVIDRQEIERSGASNVAQVLSYLPEVSLNNSGDSSTGTVGGSVSGNEVGVTTVQLRGLPQGTTLVLINGRRAGSSATGYDSDFFDLSTIPLGLVERIEVLPMGASAVYGGDGLAGVVNIVLRRDADSIEIYGRITSADGYSERNGGITWGKAWVRGRVMVTASWRNASTLNSHERNITADSDYRRFGGPDRRRLQAYPGNIYSMEGCGAMGEYGYACFVPLNDRGNLPGINASFASVPVGQSGTSLTPQDFSGSAGNLNRTTENYQIISPSRQYGIGLNGSFQLSEQSEVFAEWNMTDRSVPAREMALSISGGEYGFNSSLISSANPFNPFGVDVGIDYRFENTEIFQEYSQTYWRGLVGIRNDSRNWGWEITAWRSEESSDTGNVGYFDSSVIEQHLQSSDPANAFNPFTGDGSLPVSLDVLRQMVAQVEDGFGTSVTGLNGFIRGSLQTPAGRATALMGAEYERMTLDANPWSSAIASVAGEDDRKAAFAEARVPILAGDDSRWDRLSMSAAARYESTGRSQGNAFTKGVGIDFRPTKMFSIRANYNTAFKPLNLSSASMEEQIYDTVVSDPMFGGDYFFVPMILNGGTPIGLRPETSRSRNIAFIYAPSNDTKLSMMYWSSKLRDSYYYIGASGIVENEDIYPERVSRDPDTGLITLVDARVINVSETDVSGVDFGAEGLWSTQYGDILGSINASYVYQYDEKLNQESDVESKLAKWSSTGWSPRWKIVPRISWYLRDQASVTLTGRYVSSYEDPVPLVTIEGTPKSQRLGDFWLIDLNTNFDVSRWLTRSGDQSRGVKVVLGATNLLNRLPDYCNACVSMGRPYDATQYDIVGRRIYAELRLAF